MGKDNSEACFASTQEQLGRIQSALQNFTTTQGRLPKPARVNEGSSNPQFGTEAMGTVTDPTDALYATNVPPGITHHSGVLIGTVPHSLLGLTTDDASDCWGNKFTYAVTNALTSSNAVTGYPSAANGAITVNSNTLSAPQLVSNSMAYVVVSHGVDKYGATPMSANDRTPMHCNGSSEPKIDRENCNSDAIFYNSTRNTGDTGDHFDDVVGFGAKMKMPASCIAGIATWMTDCTASYAVMAHGTSEVVANTAPGYTGSVTLTCTDGMSTPTVPTCTPSGPTCDSDSSDGLTGGQKYCSGVVVADGSGDLVCSGGIWGASYPYSCGAGQAAQCLSGSASSSFNSVTSGCSPPPDCSGGDTLPTIDCYESSTCTCN